MHSHAEGAILLGRARIGNCCGRVGNSSAGPLAAMLSGHKIGAEHVTYYLSYVERGGEPGRWLGRAAEALGLEGVLQAQDFANLAEGRGPDGSQLLEQVRSDRVMGWDFTMSAPKSLSLLATLHPDEETRAALRSVHDQAVAAGLAWRTRAGPPDGATGAVMATWEPSWS